MEELRLLCGGKYEAKRARQRGNNGSVKRWKGMKNMDVKVTHVMADGTVLDSIKGHVIPVTDATKPYYDTLYNIALRMSEENLEKKSKEPDKEEVTAVWGGE